MTLRWKSGKLCRRFAENDHHEEIGRRRRLPPRSRIAPASAALKVGAAAPDFTAPATLGGKEFTFALADALKHGPVVLYFYPAAFTKGCTIEAHEFAEAMPQFEALGVTVIGVSHDNIETLNKFSTTECQQQVSRRRGRR